MTDRFTVTTTTSGTMSQASSSASSRSGGLSKQDMDKSGLLSQNVQSDLTSGSWGEDGVAGDSLRLNNEPTDMCGGLYPPLTAKEPAKARLSRPVRADPTSEVDITEARNVKLGGHGSQSGHNSNGYSSSLLRSSDLPLKKDSESGGWQNNSPAHRQQPHTRDWTDHPGGDTSGPTDTFKFQTFAQPGVTLDTVVQKGWPARK